MKLQITSNAAYKQPNVAGQIFVKTVPAMKRLQLLTEADKTEVLKFLKSRPAQTVVTTSFIRDNGMENADNRVTNICLLSNVEFKGAHRSFVKAGFKIPTVRKLYLFN